MLVLGWYILGALSSYHSTNEQYGQYSVKKIYHLAFIVPKFLMTDYPGMRYNDEMSAKFNALRGLNINFIWFKFYRCWILKVLFGKKSHGRPDF